METLKPGQSWQQTRKKFNSTTTKSKAASGKVSLRYFSEWCPSILHSPIEMGSCGCRCVRMTLLYLCSRLQHLLLLSGLLLHCCGSQFMLLLLQRRNVSRGRHLRAYKVKVTVPSFIYGLLFTILSHITGTCTLFFVFFLSSQCLSLGSSLSYLPSSLQTSLSRLLFSAQILPGFFWHWNIHFGSWEKKGSSFHAKGDPDHAL